MGGRDKACRRWRGLGGDGRCARARRYCRCPSHCRSVECRLRWLPAFLILQRLRLLLVFRILLPLLR